MEKSIEQAGLITLSVIVSSLIIGTIAMYSSLSYSVYNIKIRQDAVRNYMESKSKLYDYDNKIVNGSDIIDVILTNTRLYTFEINTITDTYIISFEQEGKLDGYGVQYGSKIWTEDYLRQILGDNITSDFKSELIRDEKQGIITKIKFTRR